VRRLIATDDEDAHTAVVPDVITELVTSVEQALRNRGWCGVR
jgi:hypothetical protein